MATMTLAQVHHLKALQLEDIAVDTDMPANPDRAQNWAAVCWEYRRAARLYYDAYEQALGDKCQARVIHANDRYRAITGINV